MQGFLPVSVQEKCSSGSFDVAYPWSVDLLDTTFVNNSASTQGGALALECFTET